jgi:hypothetical protein
VLRMVGSPSGFFPSTCDQYDEPIYNQVKQIMCSIFGILLYVSFVFILSAIYPSIHELLANCIQNISWHAETA